MMDEPRAITAEELTQTMLEHIRQTARYWARQADQTDLQKCEGVAFSIMSMLDGCTMDLPAFDLVARPADEDKAFHIEEGQNWIEDGTTISDMLHERFYR